MLNVNEGFYDFYQFTVGVVADESGDGDGCEDDKG